jgi:hypothetical protein
MTTTIYVLLGQSNTGDDDRLENIGVAAYPTMEAAKAAAQKNAEDSGNGAFDVRELGGDSPPMIEWADLTDGNALARIENSHDLMIRRIVVDTEVEIPPNAKIEITNPHTGETGTYPLPAGTTIKLTDNLCRCGALLIGYYSRDGHLVGIVHPFLGSEETVTYLVADDGSYPCPNDDEQE